MFELACGSHLEAIECGHIALKDFKTAKQTTSQSNPCMIPAFKIRCPVVRKVIMTKAHPILKNHPPKKPSWDKAHPHFFKIENRHSRRKNSAIGELHQQMQAKSELRYAFHVIFAIEFGVLAFGAQCPSLEVPSCNSKSNIDIYPESFHIFNAYEGQIFTSGNVVMIVAKFPDSVCDLPDARELGPECNPTMTLKLFNNGGSCFNVSTESAELLEYDFGFSFADDPNLETDNGIYNHWSFIFPVGCLHLDSRSGLL
jgi:hypothetical protein